MNKEQGREPYFDNIKGILILLVVFGHIIQKYIHNTRSFLYIPFIIIYCFHMPLFVFISGYFSKNAKKTQDTAFERFLLPYIVWAFVYFIIITLTQWKSDFNFARPWFAYWYFPTLFTLCLFLPLLVRIRFCIVILAILPLVIGFYPAYSWDFSLSRTICFTFFFLLGYHCDGHTLERLRSKKWVILLLTLAALAVLMYLCLTPLVQGNIGKIEHSLWLAEPYRDSRVAGATGVVYRLIIMATAVIFGACMLAFAPRKKTIFSLAGQNSLIVFIFHGYLVQYLNDFVTFDPGSFTGIALMALISVGTTIFLSLPIFHTVYMRLMGLIQRCVLRQTT